MTEPAASPQSPKRRRRLPVGPVGMLVITTFSLVLAFAVAAVLLELWTDDTPDVVEVLDEDAASSLVDGDPGAALEVGDPAPAAELELLDDTSSSIAELAGTPLLVNFWSSTCAPCLEEMPAFEAIHRRYGDSVVVLGVDVVDTEEAGAAMIERTGVTYRNARDPGGEIFAAYGGTALPRTVLVSAEGTVLAVHSGALDEDELIELLDEHGIRP